MSQTMTLAPMSDSLVTTTSKSTTYLIQGCCERGDRAVAFG
jgi:hypothetical protein